MLELRAVGGYRLRPAGERHLVDHYLDTAQRDLLREYACRSLDHLVRPLQE